MNPKSWVEMEERSPISYYTLSPPSVKYCWSRATPATAGVGENLHFDTNQNQTLNVAQYNQLSLMTYYLRAQVLDSGSLNLHLNSYQLPAGPVYASLNETTLMVICISQDYCITLIS